MWSLEMPSLNSGLYVLYFYTGEIFLLFGGFWNSIVL